MKIVRLSYGIGSACWWPADPARRTGRGGREGGSIGHLLGTEPAANPAFGDWDTVQFKADGSDTTLVMPVGADAIAKISSAGG